MPGVLRAQVTLQRTTFLPEDVIVNTFHFATLDPTPTAAEITAISLALDAFYDTVTTSGSAVRQYLNQTVAAAGHRLKMYALTDPEPRFPVYDEPFVITTPTGAPIPSEVALCLSFQSAPASGVNMARRRGRVFIGPLNTAALLTGTDDAYPNSTFTATLVAAGVRLRNDPDCVWGVWSPTGSEFNTIASVWVDNSFDTQRRRGKRPTARVTG